MMRTKISNVSFKYYASAIIKLLLFIALTLPISTLAADEDKPRTQASSSEDSNTSSPEKKPEPKKAPSKTQSSKTKKSSRFKPSEEISEDYSVPFPVDI